MYCTSTNFFPPPLFCILTLHYLTVPLKTLSYWIFFINSNVVERRNFRNMANNKKKD